MRVLGSPAINAMDFARNQVYLKRIPQIAQEIKQLKQLIDEIKNEK